MSLIPFIINNPLTSNKKFQKKINSLEGKNDFSLKIFLKIKIKKNLIPKLPIKIKTSNKSKTLKVIKIS